MADALLDASAVMALLRGEAGAERVLQVLPDSAISAVNYAEVISKLIDLGAPAAQAIAAAGQLALEIIPLDGSMAIRAGALRQATRSRGLSLGDRACLALATQTGLPTLTADRAWAELDLEVEVVLIR
jgi:PIN domain nuclease of toxin-antitoxin system